MIYRLGTEPPWFCDFGFNLCVDFCLWTLEVDGLQVPPFAHHPSGDGALQASEILPEGRHGKAAWKQLEALQQLPLEPPDPAEALWNALNPFYVYGEVVDHGFDITRVRLISPNGVALEDTVQDGLVLLVSDQPIFTPLQAELYNRAGDLVS